MDLVDYKKLGSEGLDHWWFSGKRELLGILLSEICSNKENRILEIGCGIGYNFQIISRYGEAFFLDSSKEALEHASKNSGSYTICADAENLPFMELSLL